MGKFVVVEGADFTGKTTFAEQLVRVLAKKNIVALDHRLPGGSLVGEKMRDILVNHDLSSTVKELLFMANRIVLSERFIETLKYSHVICTRWELSAKAYRPDSKVIRSKLVRHVDILKPDIYVLLEMPADMLDKAMAMKGEQDLLGAQNIKDYKAVCGMFKEAYDECKEDKIIINYNVDGVKPPTDDEFVSLYYSLLKKLDYFKTN